MNAFLARKKRMFPCFSLETNTFFVCCAIQESVPRDVATLEPYLNQSPFFCPKTPNQSPVKIGRVDNMHICPENHSIVD